MRKDPDSGRFGPCSHDEGPDDNNGGLTIPPHLQLRKSLPETAPPTTTDSDQRDAVEPSITDERKAP